MNTITPTSTPVYADLPNEVVCHIMDFIDLENDTTLHLVCKNWKNLTTLIKKRQLNDRLKSTIKHYERYAEAPIRLESTPYLFKIINTLDITATRFFARLQTIENESDSTLLHTFIGDLMTFKLNKSSLKNLYKMHTKIPFTQENSIKLCDLLETYNCLNARSIMMNTALPQ